LIQPLDSDIQIAEYAKSFYLERLSSFSPVENRQTGLIEETAHILDGFKPQRMCLDGKAPGLWMTKVICHQGRFVDAHGLAGGSETHGTAAKRGNFNFTQGATLPTGGRYGSPLQKEIIPKDFPKTGGDRRGKIQGSEWILRVGEAMVRRIPEDNG